MAGTNQDKDTEGKFNEIRIHEITILMVKGL